MTAQLKIDQTGLSAGVAGKSRTDGLDTGALVTLTNTGTGSTTAFALLWTPPSDTTAVATLAATGNPKIWTFTPTPGSYGTYRVQLVENSGTGSEKRETRVFVVRTKTLGLIVPSLNETGDPTASLTNAGLLQIQASENNADDFSDAGLNARSYAGWWRALHETIVALDALDTDEIRNASTASGALLSDALDALSASVTTVSGALAALDSGDVANASGVTGATVTAALGTLSSAITAVTSSLSILGAQVSGLTSTNVSNSSTVTGIKVTDALETLKSAIATANTSIATVSSTVAALNSTAIANVSSVSGSSVTAALNTLSTAVSTLTTTVGALTSSSISNASGVTGTTVTSALNALDASIGAVSSSLSSLGTTVTNLRRGTWHVDDFGAVPQPFIIDGVGITDPERTSNVTAIQAALDAALAAGGGTVVLGPGYYYTNAAVGYDLAIDLNVKVTIQGLAPGYTGIHCNSHTEPAFKLHTTVGSLHLILMRDLAFKGGREGLSLVSCTHSRFERLRFWGSDTFALYDQAGVSNVFAECSFNDSATGALDGGVTPGDAVVLNSSEDTITDCNFRENCGGIVVNSGANLIEGCIFANCTYRGRGWHDYVADEFIDPSSTWLALVPAAIIAGGGRLNIVGCFGAILTAFVGAFRQYELTVTGCQLRTGSGSLGFINVWTDSVDTALHVSGCTFVALSGSGSNYFISNGGPVTLHDSIVEGLSIAYPGDTVTPLSSSAPALLNPGSENNLVNVRTFIRTVF